mgnify:CR=1 FL=1
MLKINKVKKFQNILTEFSKKAKPEEAKEVEKIISKESKKSIAS